MITSKDTQLLVFAILAVFTQSLHSSQAQGSTAGSSAVPVVELETAPEMACIKPLHSLPSKDAEAKQSSSERKSGDMQKPITHPTAEELFELAEHNRMGKGVEKNPKLAAHYYKLSAQQGYAPALCSLGVCYKNGDGLEMDIKKAIELYQLAAKQNYARAQFNLGCCFSNGRGTRQNMKCAVEWFKQAAKNGFAGAQFALALRYKDGDTVKQDSKQAFQYFQLAANQDHAGALYQLGLCYARGTGVKKDLTQALKLYLQAALQGDTDAKRSFCKAFDRKLVPQKQKSQKMVALWKSELVESKKQPDNKEIAQINCFGLYDGVSVYCEGETCVVCYAQFKQRQKIAILPCFHVFCSKCIQEWFNEKRNHAERPTCPLCRDIGSLYFQGQVKRA